MPLFADTRLAIPVLRSQAPKYAHDVRRGCLAAADMLEGLKCEPHNGVTISHPVKLGDGTLLGHAQMMVDYGPDGEIYTSSWWTPIEEMLNAPDES